jgi:hypothetical protein
MDEKPPVSSGHGAFGIMTRPVMLVTRIMRYKIDPPTVPWFLIGINPAAERSGGSPESIALKIEPVLAGQNFSTSLILVFLCA